MKILVGILTVSDRCSRGEAEDRSGPLLKRLAEAGGWECVELRIVPDDPGAIEAVLKEWCDGRKLPLVLTTGGTGIGPRDVTPEVTRSLLEKELPGVAEMMRLEGLRHTPFASLSRGAAGVRKQSLILNLPGSPKGAEESFAAAIPIIPHALGTLAGAGHESAGAHEESGCHAPHAKREEHEHREHTCAHHAGEQLLPVSEAVARILAEVKTLGAEEIALGEAGDRILAESLTAREDSPPFDNSAMDGYAVRAGDLANAGGGNPVALPVQERIAAGAEKAQALRAGHAARIMTGAPLPDGADAVVMQELTRRENGRVTFARSVEPGESVRRKGEDVRAGDKLLDAGALLRPYEIALLASQGFAGVKAIRMPRVSIITTGDELVPAGAKLKPGKIRDSNGPALIASLKRWGIVPLDFGIVPDDEKAIEKEFKKALDKGDALLITGGVSVGELDFTRPVLARLGVKEIFWRVALKPGKPFWFGVSRDGKPVFGLPGNPVSVLVCLEELVRPALEKMQGKESKHPSYHLRGKTVNDYPKPGDRLQFLFCNARQSGDGFELEIIRPQGSHMSGMAARANALAIAPQNVSRIKAGDELLFRWLK